MSKYFDVSFAVALFLSGVGKAHGSSVVVVVCFGVSLVFVVILVCSMLLVIFAGSVCKGLIKVGDLVFVMC